MYCTRICALFMYFYRPFERSATDNEFIVAALRAFDELRTQLTPEILNELAVFTSLETLERTQYHMYSTLTVICLYFIFFLSGILTLNIFPLFSVRPARPLYRYQRLCATARSPPVPQSRRVARSSNC